MRSRPGPLRNQVVMIVLLLTMLVGVILFEKRCGRGVSSFFKAIDVPADGGRRD